MTQFPNQPPFNPGQPAAPQAPAFPQQPQAPQGFPQAPAGYAPTAAAPAGYAQPAAPAGYAPGYQPMPQQPAYAPAAQGYGLPQNQAAGQAPQVDVDGAGDEGSEFPKCTWCGGAPWYLTLKGYSENPSFYGGKIGAIVASVRQSPDPAFPPGTIVSVLIKGLEKGTQNNKAQSRKKGFLAAVCQESTIQGPGHFAGRTKQAERGELNDRPFAVSFSQREVNNIDPNTNLKRVILLPSFQQG